MFVYFLLLACINAHSCRATFLTMLENRVMALETQIDELLARVGNDTNRRNGITSSGCDDLYRAGHREDGVYNYILQGEEYNIYCQFNYEESRRNWMVIQRRSGGLINFFRDADAYANGFGDKAKEFWMGLRFIHLLTSSERYILRVDLENFSGNRAYAEYKTFSVDNETTSWTLHIGNYSGNAGNSMGDLDGAEFSTYDQDNDDWVYNCADQRHGAWWYKSCTFANLNGMYLENGAEDFRGVYWFYWTHTVAGLKTVEMKIRPI